MRWANGGKHGIRVVRGALNGRVTRTPWRHRPGCSGSRTPCWARPANARISAACGLTAAGVVDKHLRRRSQMWTIDAMEYGIRRAERADAPGACEAVRCSIAELCTEDHGGDEASLAAWLSNKTVQNVTSWISSPRNIAAVAEASAGIIGFGLLSQPGTLALLYVSPAARFHGVSKGLLTFLEDEARQLGMREIRLESTATARRFYLSRGFSPFGEPSPAFGAILAYPMRKDITR